MLEGDAEALEELLSVELIITDEDGRSISRDEVVAELRSGRLRLEIMELEDLQIRGTERGRNRLVAGAGWAARMRDGRSPDTMPSPGSGHGRYGEWRVAAEHSSTVAY